MAEGESDGNYAVTEDPTQRPPGDGDPRALLAKWANDGDEWVRFIVAEVLSTGRALAEPAVGQAHDLFRQEKALDDRTLPKQPQLSVEGGPQEEVAPLSITRLSEVRGVNALLPGAVVQPHPGLTILYGENGTGKTGYSRIFKALAASRTADQILGDVRAAGVEPLHAKMEYKLGDEERALDWDGTQGVAPFTRMSIFDSPSVTYHVDDDLEYVYVPAALALFTHVIHALRGVQDKIDAEVAVLNSGASSLLARIPKEATAYPLVETLGASTDVTALRSYADFGADIDGRLETLRQTVAALQANTIEAQVLLRQREVGVLSEAEAVATGLRRFDRVAYNAALTRLAELQTDYETFRSELFGPADLPAEPDETWSAFLVAGDLYRQHLVAVDSHEEFRCLYCRQTLADPARQLIDKYSEYLEGRISADIKRAEVTLAELAQPLQELAAPAAAAYIAEFQAAPEAPLFVDAMRTIESTRANVVAAVTARTVLKTDFETAVSTAAGGVSAALTTMKQTLRDLEQQARDRTQTLRNKRLELNQLVAAAELARSWAAIETQVASAKQADRLTILRNALPRLARSVTELSKTASDLLINQSFDKLFVEECEALRAPTLKVEFVGRQGRAQRRKVLSGKHRPSKVLSEGEQKVLAIADFLAEARLAGITAPVVFDDPVSSLDHRRINEVAQRVANLAEDNQVIVFTHDIFFATTLLALFEKSKRCSYFQITDEAGKGRVTAATGPRWDTLSNIKGRINDTIQAARSQEGEARAALVERGYSLVRSWCEVFTETELLRGVTQRYQPNIGMTKLPQIKTAELPGIIDTVVRIFEDACRYIDGHSQPLVTLGVSPTLAGLEAHWAELVACKKANDAA